MNRLTGLFPRLLAFSVALLCAPLVCAPAAWAEEPVPWGLWTLAPQSPLMEEIVSFNNMVTVIITGIVVVVFALLAYVLVKFRASKNPKPATFTHNNTLEFVWTLIPVLILVGIAFPSFHLLYAESRLQKADLTIKVTGHQWYWTYTYSDYNYSFDSNLVQDADLKPGQPRLLTADHPLMLPVGKNVRIQIASDDVIHDWSVVPLGVKDDAMPGRLNETWTRINAPGTYYGQCSQLCGINHGYMPIEVIGVSPDEFQAWINQHKGPVKSSSLGGAATLADATVQR